MSAVFKIKADVLDGDLIAAMRGDHPGQDPGERISCHEALLLQIARNTRPAGQKPLEWKPPGAEVKPLPAAAPAGKKGTVGKSA